MARLNFKEIEGQKFGKLTAIRFSHHNEHGKAYFRFACDCGNKITNELYRVRSGMAKSCGCAARELLSRNRRKHMMSGTKEFNTWSAMRRRCHNPTDNAYRHYGGRGISVCAKWRKSFSSFLSDVGRAPSAEHSIGRIDNDKGYSPSNVEWQTTMEQARNRRSSRVIRFSDKALTLAEWAETTGISADTIAYRIAAGWPLHRALDPKRGKTGPKTMDKELNA